MPLKMNVAPGEAAACSSRQHSETACCRDVESPTNTTDLTRVFDGPALFPLEAMASRVLRKSWASNPSIALRLSWGTHHDWSRSTRWAQGRGCPRWRLLHRYLSQSRFGRNTIHSSLSSSCFAAHCRYPE